MGVHHIAVHHAAAVVPCRATAVGIQPRVLLLRIEYLSLSCDYQHRNDHRFASRHWHPPAVFQLRRLVAVGVHHIAVHHVAVGCFAWGIYTVKFFSKTISISAR